jgi:hypothetical protein
MVGPIPGGPAVGTKSFIPLSLRALQERCAGAGGASTGGSGLPFTHLHSHFLLATHSDDYVLPVWAKELCWATFLVRSALISTAWNQVMFVLIHSAMLPSSLCRVRKGYPCIHVSDWRVQLGCQVIITMPYTRVNWSCYRMVPLVIPRLLLLPPLTHPPTMSPAPPQAPIAISEGSLVPRLGQ